LLVLAGASRAQAQSVSGTGDVSPAAPVAPGSPSWTVSGELDVGNTAVGALSINSGGTVTSDSATIGVNAGSQGTVTVSGADGSGHASTWTNPGDLVIGYTGTGTLNIMGGGKVTAGTTTIGLDVGGDSQLTVDGQGSSFASSARLDVGEFGSGHLLIQNRGAVSDSDSIIGSTFQGDAVVTGAGSTWTSANQLTIGSFASGSLLIENGASVTSAQGYIGASNDGSGDIGNGTVTVTGAGSSWSITTYNLTLGNEGGATGSLTVSNGGLVQAAGGVLLGTNAGASGTVTLQSGGVLETPVIDGGSGTASVTLDGGVLRATQDNQTFFYNFGAQTITLGANGGVIDTNGYAIGIDPVLVGAGGLTKIGGGTLVLTGANTYAGATQVSAGRLEIDGDQSGAMGLTTVTTGATLAGTGIVGGNVAVVGGVIAPGTTAAPGTLTINGSLSLDANSSLNYRLGQAGAVGGTLNDLLVVHGDLTLAGVLNVTQPAGGMFGPGVYRLINYDGALTNNGLTLGTLPAGDSNVIQTSITGQVNLIDVSGVMNFWDGPQGLPADNVITGGGGVWQVGGASVWTVANGQANGAFQNGVFAVFSAAPGTVTVDDNAGGPVSVSGIQFASNGYIITGGAIGLEAGDAIVRVGDGASDGAAFKATIASELTGTGQLDKTDLGTLILTGANSYTGGTKISSGTLQIGNGGAAGSIPGDAEVEGTLAFDRSDVWAFGGAISGAGQVQQIGTGTTVLSGNSSAFSGQSQVMAGTLEVDGVLGGSTQVLQGGRLAGVGQVGPTSNSGVIAPGAGGFETLTVAGGYTGQGGNLDIKTQLGGDSSPTSRLAVAGATSGVTSVTVTNVGGRGAQTQKGIEVVQVNGASGGQFTLANGDYVFKGQSALVAGAYGYVLRKDPADGSWYLRSSLPGPGGTSIPLYQPGVPIYEAYASMFLSLSQAPTLLERVGDRRYDPADTDHGGVWARLEGTSSRLEPSDSLTGVHQDINSWKMQFGVDRMLLGAQDGARLVGGLNAQFGTAGAQVSSTYGGGNIDTRTYGLGATLTWYGQHGVYVDAQTQTMWFQSDLSSKLAGRLANGDIGHDYGLSVETGKAFAVAGNLSLTPQAQLSYASTGFGSFNDRFGANVDSGRGDSLLGRVGLALDHKRSWQDGAGQTHQLSLYGIVNFKYELLDGTDVLVSGTPFAGREGRSWGGFGGGGNYSWGNGRYSVYGEATADTDLSGFGNSYAITATAGFRARF